ncbi:acetamidase [Paenibacillus sp. CCS19]|uniref:acetamidase/formamidase family protein n=1 Tax=Paenibacillus sp. CCS19 TaxID=3158387 RepID=UPI00256B9E25|nr:acetamidase/formamidase family protein [Paenibacillus cellulosilyticus]GMK37634.1 acetamidase [Paenibacillus cellulosilyticus]
MEIYKLRAERSTLHGSFSKEIEPALTINSGDSVQFQTLDGGWGYYCQTNGKRMKFPERNRETDKGHALCGPIYIHGAKPGMTLEVQINNLVPGACGFTSAGQWPNWQNQKLNLMQYNEITLDWKLDVQEMIGQTTIRDRIFSVDLKPFMGVMGMPPDEPGTHSTFPPRFCGGNIDCKELTRGSSLFLPIPVEGALFSVGDGHALQGDGEVSCQAIECPMELADLTFYIHDQMSITMPRARTPLEWITFGFHEDLNEAAVQALDGMLDLLREQYGIHRVEAMALGSAVIDLRITQIVNGIKGVHACISHEALRVSGV